MGAAAYRGKGFKERAMVSGERPIGATSCRQQSIPASCQPPPPPPRPPSSQMGLCRLPPPGHAIADAPPGDGAIRMR